MPNFDAVPPMGKLEGKHKETSLAHAIKRYLALMDTVRDGDDVHELADIPGDPTEHSNHLKAASYYFDASMVGICALDDAHILDTPRKNQDIKTIRDELETGELRQFANNVEELYKGVIASTKV